VTAAFTLAQIVLIDLSLAADNALIVGFLVASLPTVQRNRAMGWGIAAATVLRILMAFFAVQLLRITGLMLAGGVLLVWVAWKMARDYQHMHRSGNASEPPQAKPPKKMVDVIWQIVVADVSMSLDNVLGVAGIAREHMALLAAGLVLSVALMGFASTLVARLTVRYPKIALLGTMLILYTALSMIYDGGHDLGFWSSIRALA